MKEKIYNLLRWSEKYTKTDMVYLAEGGSALFLGSFISAIAVFGIGVAFANLLPKESYGIYKYVLSVASIVGTISLSGLSASVARGVARNLEGTLKKAFGLSIRFGLITFLAAITASIYYFIKGDTALSISLGIVAVTQPIINATSLVDGYLIGKKLFGKKGLFTTVQTVGSLCVVFIVLLYTSNPVMIVASNLISQAFIISFFYFAFSRKIKTSVEIDNEAISFGKHLSFLNSVGTLSSHLDKILLFHFFGAAELAIYAFATAIPSQLSFLSTSAKTLSMPKMSALSIKELKKIIPAKALIFFIAMSVATIIYILVAPAIFKYIFPQYIESLRFSQVFSLIILSYPISLYGQVFVAHAAKKTAYFIRMTDSLSGIAFVIILTPLFGLWGVVAAALLRRLTNAIVLLYHFRRL